MIEESCVEVTRVLFLRGLNTICMQKARNAVKH